MTKEALQEILHVLELDYEAEPTLVYVFYALPDGRVDNFSISVHSGRSMTDNEIVNIMRREYPATRDAKVISVERPEQQPPKPRKEEWLDANEVCKMLHISRRTLKRWTDRGLFIASQMGDRLYYSRDEIDRALRANIISESGRVDTIGI